MDEHFLEQGMLTLLCEILHNFTFNLWRGLIFLEETTIQQFFDFALNVFESEWQVLYLRYEGVEEAVNNNSALELDGACGEVVNVLDEERLVFVTFYQG